MKEQFAIDQQTSKYAGQQIAIAEPATASFNQSMKLNGPGNLTLSMQASDIEAHKGLNTLGNSLIKPISDPEQKDDQKMDEKD